MKHPLVIDICPHLPLERMLISVSLSGTQMWFKHAVLELARNPYYTSHMFWPVETDLLFHSLSFFNAVVSLPVQLFVGLVAAYNFAILFSYVVGALGMYLLAENVTGSHAGAIVGGMAFSFGSYHFAYTFGHLNLTSIEWIPFYTLTPTRLPGEFTLKEILSCATSPIVQRRKTIGTSRA